MLQKDADVKNSQQFRKATEYLWEKKNPSRSLNTKVQPTSPKVLSYELLETRRVFGGNSLPAS